MARQRKTYHGYANVEAYRTAQEARDVLHTRLDLDLFLALDSEARAARWRGWSLSAKMDAVIQMLERRFLERGGALADLGQAWDDELVAQWIAKYDAKWGAEPTATEVAVVAALEVQQDQADLAERHARNGAERSAAQAEQRAVSRALEHFHAGARARQLASGAWTVDSSALDGSRYEVSAGRCTCPRGAARCWHKVLRNAYELATDHYAEPSGRPHGDDPTPTAPTSITPPSTPTPTPAQTRALSPSALARWRDAHQRFEDRQAFEAQAARLTPELLARFQYALARRAFRQRWAEEVLLDGVPLSAYEVPAARVVAQAPPAKAADVPDCTTRRQAQVACARLRQHGFGVRCQVFGRIYLITRDRRQFYVSTERSGTHAAFCSESLTLCLDYVFGAEARRQAA